jgi:glyoxylase-like metal-dependent hydrolase (beta-lactamase superfamily II)
VTVPGETGFPDGAAVLNLDVAWIHGSEAAKYNTDPDIQVHACDEHTYIMRQNMAVSYEAPFMFLLFGVSRAVLLDTGATANPEFFPLRRIVDSIMEEWLAGHPHPDDYGLLVLHTHSHTDHTAADGQFAQPRRQNTRPPAWKTGGRQPGENKTAQPDFLMAVDTRPWAMTNRLRASGPQMPNAMRPSTGSA